MQQTTTNLCYLLWRDRRPRQEWAARLAQWAGCDTTHAEALLRDTNLLPDEIRRIAGACGVSEEDLAFANLLEEAGVSALSENVKYLVESLERGGKARLATALKVDVSTISRWRSGDLKPRDAHVKALHGYFRLPVSVDLYIEPIFLWPKPLTEAARRDWLHRRLDALSTETLHDLFPALERLLGES